MGENLVRTSSRSSRLFSSLHFKRNFTIEQFTQKHFAGNFFCLTRSYAALRAADLDWIIAYFFRTFIGQSDHFSLQTLFVTDAGSQLTFVGQSNHFSLQTLNVTHAGSQLTFVGQSDHFSLQTLFVSNAGSQLTF